MASRRLRNAPAEASGGAKLKIQLGIARRMAKEVAAYELEVTTNEARIQKMRDDGKDIYDIRKQEEVLQESYMMVPDSKTRLEAVMEELRAAVDGCDGDDTVGKAMLAEACELMEAATA